MDTLDELSGYMASLSDFKVDVDKFTGRNKKSGSFSFERQCSSKSRKKVQQV
jgi:hypothetical protein